MGVASIEVGRTRNFQTWSILEKAVKDYIQSNMANQV